MTRLRRWYRGPLVCCRAEVVVGLCAVAVVAAAGAPVPVDHDPLALPLAYIGPGAGVALAGSLAAVLTAMLSAFLALLSWPIRWLWRSFRNRKALARAKVRRVVILGLDGLDPDLVDQFLREGRLPNLARLRDEGSYTRLGTTWPPLSPVAWSSFSTGTNPGKHNIFDFISRNTADYCPTMSSVQIGAPKRVLKLGRLQIPLSATPIKGLRKSKPFWRVLGDAGIFSSVLRVPITFPPDKFHGVQLSAMCVPDLRGTQGTFCLFTETGEHTTSTEGDVGGERVIVERNGNTITGKIPGPPNPLVAGAPDTETPFKVILQPGGGGELQLAGEKIPLIEGQYTDWVDVPFRLLATVKIQGVSRFMLKRSSAPFEMYCTPINIDPDKPVMPISHPKVFSIYLAKLLGKYATLGLAEDTWSLSEGVNSEDAFLAQAYDIDRERQEMFFDSLKRVRRGMVTCVFDGPDRIQHMFWRFHEEGHPALNGDDREAYQYTIRDMYERMDKLVGRTVDAVGSQAALFVMSDHGFKSFRRGVGLNAWLLENGYLKLKDGATTSDRVYLADVDWSGTRAYAIGLAGIFVNEQGREAEGIVTRSEKGPLVEEICRQLTGLRDPEGDQEAIHEAVAREQVYSGPYVEAAPDIIVGYNVGYRVSWDAAVGKCGEAVFSDNKKAWSGDHCIHPTLVPGILFSNLKLNEGPANIVDMAPTTLDLLGVDAPGYMEGQSLVEASGASQA